MKWLGKKMRLSWVVISIVAAFFVGQYFNPGNAQSRRLPPKLTMEQMRRAQQQPMPGRMPYQRMPMQQAPQQPRR